MILFGVLALSAPPLLSIVLFRILVKDGVPFDSQKFRHNLRTLFFLWLGLILLNIYLIFFVGNAAMPARLQEASSMFKSSLFFVLFGFLSILALRKQIWVKLPDFIEHFPLHLFLFVTVGVGGNALEHLWAGSGIMANDLS